jgi:hypothetical protein
MASLVTGLQKDILNSKKSVTEILRTAKLISAKLGLKDVSALIEAELDGYGHGKSVPPYRVLRGGTLQFYNPYHGWLPAGDVGNYGQAIGQPIAELEELAKGKAICIPVHNKFELSSLGGVGDDLVQQFQQRIVHSPVRLKGILEAVREQILNWAIELEQKGITGEDMTFDKEEKQKAQSQTFNIQHFTGVFGDVTNSSVNIYDYSSIYQQLKQAGITQAERNELENILDELKANPPPAKKRSLIQKGKAWIVKNQEILGASASIVRQALGIPNVT